MISHKGFNEQVLTFKTSGTLNAGSLVTISANDTVAAASSGDKVYGIVLNVRNEFAAVQVGGYAEVAYTTSGSNTMSLGDGTYVANGSGGIIAGSGGRVMTVVNIDTTNNICGIIF